MITKLSKFKNNTFIKNVLVLVSGTAAAQIVAMALSPIITRLYGPEAFGIMGTFNAIVSIIGPVAALTYPITIVLPKKDRDAKGIIKLSLLIAGFIAMLTTLILLLFSKQILNLFNIEELSFFIYLIPLVIVFASLMQVAEQWLIRTKQFKINAKVTFYQSVIINGGKVGAGFIYPYGATLVIFTAIADGLKAFMLFFFSRKNKYKKEIKDEQETSDKKKLRELARSYYDFPLYRAPEVFLNAVSQGIPVLMLTALFGPASAGFYSIGRTVLVMPSSLIGKSVGDVFYPRVAEAAQRGENITSLIRRATLALGGLGLLPFGLVILFGPFLFSFVFGEDWAMAGEYARWIALWSFVGFMNRPSVMSLPVLKAQRFHLIYTIIMLTTRLGILVASYYIFSDDLIAVALFGISGAILNFGLIAITLRISKRKMVR